MKNPFSFSLSTPRLLGTALVLLLPGLAAAQAPAIPNSSFESWQPRAGEEAPDGWQTSDDIVEFLTQQRTPTGTVTKAPDAQQGTLAVQLQTRTVPGLGQISGDIILGSSLHGGVDDLPGGLPCTARPAALEFYYQMKGNVADSAAALVRLTRNVNGTAELVAEALFMVPAQTSAYTLARVPLHYYSSLTPDSVMLRFTSGSVDIRTDGTTLLVDNISLTGTVLAARGPAKTASLAVWPNPSPDGRYRLGSTEPALLTAPLVVLDVAGRTVHREAALRPGLTTAERFLDLGDLPAGVYTVQVQAPTGVITRQLIR
ncbi:hypothetical protein GCM10022409_18960 [Hymenobacter glaciei]|uniref:Secretion system C-terminal sorting domain-containing protein n=1 Tax=Hymenobacter glaciei TaxID=877209 RepID=A0ABP7U292_9BACT